MGWKQPRCGNKRDRGPEGESEFEMDGRKLDANSPDVQTSSKINIKTAGYNVSKLSKTIFQTTQRKFNSVTNRLAVYGVLIKSQ